MITDIEIAEAKARTNYVLDEPHHEHNDCIRIAYEWLDAQKIRKTFPKYGCSCKGLIERWAGRYVSQSDVAVAAELHPLIKGKYPRLNISTRLVEPSAERLKNIGEAFKHSNYRESHQPKDYDLQE